MSQDEQLPTIIQTVKEDLAELKVFYNITISPRRTAVLKRYLEEQLQQLDVIDFDKLSQNEKIDLVLLENYLKSSLQQLKFDHSKNEKVLAFVGSFANTVIELCEARQHVSNVDFQEAAAKLSKACAALTKMKQAVSEGKYGHEIDKTTAYRTAYKLEELAKVFCEWHKFYSGYDPGFDWWMSGPYNNFQEELREFNLLIRKELVGIDESVKDPIVGEPIGRDGMLADLQFEKIAYTPEQLVEIGEDEYRWCEEQAKNAARDMGCGSDWRKALERVKQQHVKPGYQIYTIRDLASEATEYVKEHDLVTVPEIAEVWRMYMISAQDQKTSPFFLGGRTMQVSYPTNEMSYEDKMMSMRGNSIPLSRSTVFHELIPGHHLQSYMTKRHRPYRRLFETPFWMEGWALYWEFILWDKGFPNTPEHRMGMLFWRMHRCCRIIFSLKFHLGQMTPQECIDLLVDKVGHERATAEGEVRRSFNGDYRPLYQAGYMLGALQLYALRDEMVNGGKMTEKEFHDRVLQENQMPIEVLRALIQVRSINRDTKASWKFYKQAASM